GAPALVVAAGDFQRLHEPGRAELLQPRLADLEVLEGPTNLLGSNDLAFAELGLREAYRLDGNDAEHHAPVVVNRPDARLILHVALVLAVDDLLNFLHNRVVRPGDVEARGDEADCGVAGRYGVFLRAAPPDADDVVAWVAHLGCSLERNGVHHAIAAQDHPVRLDLANLQPLRSLLVARQRHRNMRDLEAVFLRLRIEYGDRFLAVGRVVIEVDDLLALKLVHPAFLHADELDLGGILRPVIGDQRKNVRKHASVRGIGAAIAYGDERNLVGGRLLDQRIGNACGQRHHQRGARALFLQALVTFDAAGVVVLGLALLPRQLDAVDAAVAQVDEVEVVDVAAEDAGATRRVGAYPVRKHGYELLILRGRHGRDAGQKQADQGRFEGLHGVPPRKVVYDGKPNPHRIGQTQCGVNAKSARASQARLVASQYCAPQNQCGNGQRRSFSLAICHRRARPFGSTIRKKMIKAPNTITSRLDIRPDGSV